MKSNVVPSMLAEKLISSSTLQLIRPDGYYVLAKTFGAVIHSKGAY